MMVSIFYLLICTPEFVFVVAVVVVVAAAAAADFVNARFSVRHLQVDNVPWVQ